MFKAISFVAVFLSFGSFAAPVTWMSLEAGQTYQLTQAISLSAGLKLKEGSEFVLKEIVPYEMMEVVDFELVLKRCPISKSALRTRVILYQDLYGIHLEPGCRLSVMLDDRDLFRMSLFKESFLYY
jgi:hypothetical protein